MAAQREGTTFPHARVRIPLAMMNRHGLVAGATGTGKTKSLQVMAEQLSAAGVPTFIADIKGDISGLGAPAIPKIADARLNSLGLTDSSARLPVEFFSLVRTSLACACAHGPFLRPDPAGQGPGPQ